MRHPAIVISGMLLAGACVAVPASAGPLVIYSNLTVDGRLGAATRTDAPGTVEIEAGDDFIAATAVGIETATFRGIIPAGANINDVNLEIYRVFPKDSTDPPSGHVPTRNNSPSDVAFAERGLADLSLTVNTLAPSLTTGNSVVNGIFASPNQTTGGEGAATGQEIEVTATFNNEILLPADHYFFVPQVGLTNGTFLWLSASRPIAGAGSTPINPDLQAWIRNANLDPDWLRIGTDIVGGATPPTFNMAYSLTGRAVPEPSVLLLLTSGVAAVMRRRRRV